MKRAVSFIAALVLLVTLLPLGTVTHAASQEVTLSAGGSLSDALAEVADGGTIKVEGTVAVTKAPGTHKKTVTITGGELDFSGLSGNLSLGDHITFENITLNFAAAAEGSNPPAILCNGYKVKIGEGVTMPNPIRIFGGNSGGTVASTNLTLLSGYYTQIWGGGNKGNVTGDVNLYVGGKVNSTVDATSHSKIACVFGGSYIAPDTSNTIGGTVHMVFTDSAKANYIYGGNGGSGTGTITGGTNLTVSGGSVMSVYGGGQSGSLTGDVKLLISGGTMEQVFGGSEGGAVTGDVAVDITGGTITRRVYGGCYNEVDVGLFSDTWKSSYYVNGKIVLTLHSGANITYSYSDGLTTADKATYAHSRQATLSSTEVSHLVYADSTAYTNYKDKVKAQDGIMKSVMSGVSAADYIHYHTYSVSPDSEATITQNCIDSNCSATATLVIEGNPLYTGSAVKPANVVYDGTWFGGDLAVTYTNNVNPGTGTASITCGGVTVTKDFTITRDASLYMNGVGYGSLEDAITAARKTSGPDTITLWDDVNISSWLVINTDVTLKADKEITITGTDTQTGAMIRVIGGTLTIDGTDAKITLAAGTETRDIIANYGGDIYLTNVCLTGNEATNRKVTHGIFNHTGSVTAKSVEITKVANGDGLYVLEDTTANLDNVTISDSGRYGIKVKGTVNIYNTVNADHALSVSNSADNGIDIENGGKLISHLEGVSADTYAIRLADNATKGINVRGGGSVELSHVSVTGTGEYGIYFSRNAGTGASGTVSDFQVSGAGKDAVYLAAYSTATLTNGTITNDGYCVKTLANSALTVSNVTVQTGGNAAALIRGTLSGELTEAP